MTDAIEEETAGQNCYGYDTQGEIPPGFECSSAQLLPVFCLSEIVNDAFETIHEVSKK